MSKKTNIQNTHFRREPHLESIFKQAELALIASVCGAFILAFLVGDSVPLDRLVLWGQFMAVAAAVRYLLIYAFRNSSRVSQTRFKWYVAFVATLALSGAAWGSATFLLSSSASGVGQAIILLFIMGVISGAGAAFAGDRHAFAAFAIPAVGLPVFNLFTFGDSLSQKFATVLTLFLAFLLSGAERAYRIRKSELDAENERECLANALVEENENFERLATELEARVKIRTEQLSDLNEKLQAEVFERSEAKQAATSQKARFTAAFENAPVGMLIAYQATGEIVKANTAVCEFLGYDAAELTNFRLVSLLCPSERDGAGAGDFYASESTTERRFIHRRGHVAWGRVSIGAMSGHEYTDGYVVIQIQDLSELKSAHDRLSSLGDAFGVAFESTPIPTAIIDSCGRLTRMNPRMRTIVRAGFEHINDLALASLVASDDQASLKLADFFSGRSQHIETKVTLFSGEINELEAEITASRVGAGNSADAYGVLHIDVSPGKLVFEEEKSTTNVVPLERRA
ncbi:MAG: PAS domain S-box protein [Gammaproteobacteria bacterium]